MKTYDVSLPQIAFVAGTRGLGGAGVALLLSPYLKPETRRTVGWTLLGIGLLTTIPIALRLFAIRERQGHTLH